MITTSKKNFNQVLDFLYEIQTDNSNNYFDNLLKLLNEYFCFENIGFMQQDVPGFFYLHDEFKTPSNSEIMYYSYATVNNEEMLSTYNNYFNTHDALAYSRLPKKVGRTSLLLSSEFIKNYKDDKFNTYLKYLGSLSLGYFASMYLYNKDNSYLGRISFGKPKNSGDFTRAEVQLLQNISKHISCQVSQYMEYNAAIKQLDIFKKSNSRMPLAMLILDSKFNVIESNRVAYYYCMDILTNTQCASINMPKQSTRFYIEQSVVNAVMAEPSILRDNGSKLFKTPSCGYTCTYAPCTVQDFYNEPQTLYFLYIYKESNEKQNNISKFAETYKLSPREMEVITLIIEGKSNTKIGEILFICNSTVKSHITSIYRKMDVTNRAGLLHKLNNCDGAI